MNVDPSGYFAISTLIIGTLVTGLLCGIVSGTTNAIRAASTGQNMEAAFIGGFITGAISGIGIAIALAFGGPMELLLAGFVGFGAGYLGSAVEEGISTGNYNWLKADHFIMGV